MKHLLIFLFSLTILTTCITGCKSNCSRKLQADLAVVDTDNKPIINRKVDFFISANGTNDFDNLKIGFDNVRITSRTPLQTQTTDNSGFVHFDIEEDFCVDYSKVFCFVPQDDTQFKAVNFAAINAPVSQDVNFKETLLMDKIKPLTIRFKTSRNDVVSCVTTTDWQNVNNTNLIHVLKRDIVSFKKTQASMGLDTLVFVSTFVRQSFKIKSELTFANGEFFTSYEIVGGGVNRDSVLLVKF